MPRFALTVYLIIGANGVNGAPHMAEGKEMLMLMHNGANEVNGAHREERKEILILMHNGINGAPMAERKEMQMHNGTNGVNGAPMEERKEMHYGEC